MAATSGAVGSASVEPWSSVEEIRERLVDDVNRQRARQSQPGETKQRGGRHGDLSLPKVQRFAPPGVGPAGAAVNGAGLAGLGELSGIF